MKELFASDSFDSSPSKALHLEISVPSYWAWQPASWQERAIALDKATSTGADVPFLCSPSWHHTAQQETSLQGMQRAFGKVKVFMKGSTRAQQIIFSQDSLIINNQLTIFTLHLNIILWLNVGGTIFKIHLGTFWFY